MTTMTTGKLSAWQHHCHSCVSLFVSLYESLSYVHVFMYMSRFLLFLCFSGLVLFSGFLVCLVFYEFSLSFPVSLSSLLVSSSTPISRANSPQVFHISNHPLLSILSPVLFSVLVRSSPSPPSSTPWQLSSL